MTATYAERLAALTAERGRLCVGIDPMPGVLDAWGLAHDVDGLERCARGIVEELGGTVAVFKPQSAFFEAYGSRGVAGGHGLYVLARTSNPDGGTIQLADAGGASVAQHVVDTIAALNPDNDHAVGLVVGATHRDPGCNLDAFNASILAPGVGAQGGTIEGLRAVFGPALKYVLPTASRDVIGHGREALVGRAHALMGL